MLKVIVSAKTINRFGLSVDGIELVVNALNNAQCVWFKLTDWLCTIVYVLWLLRRCRFLLLERCVIQQFLDKVHVSQQHATAAISFQSQRIECVTFGVFGLQQTQIRFPLIANHFAACETSNRNYHDECDRMCASALHWFEIEMGNATRGSEKILNSEFRDYVLSSHAQVSKMCLYVNRIKCSDRNVILVRHWLVRSTAARACRQMACGVPNMDFFRIVNSLWNGILWKFSCRVGAPYLPSKGTSLHSIPNRLRKLFLLELIQSQLT